MSISIDDIRSLIDEHEDEGLFRFDRRMFTDAEIFDLEMRHIFEENWVYLGHEAQLPNPNDFITTYIGQQPIILSRQADGAVKGFLNACQHRAAMLEQRMRGNKKMFICPFHSWSYSNDGRLIGCGDTVAAGYGPGFKKENMGLVAIARIETYRGLIFGSLRADVEPLLDFLGDARTFIDIQLDQGISGEADLIPGSQVYTYDGNWKLTTENTLDGYHVTSIHPNYVMTVANRAKRADDSSNFKTVKVDVMSKLPGGYYAFKNGHTVLWNELPNPEVRPAHAHYELYRERYGEVRAYWMAKTFRHTVIYPNLVIVDSASSQIRTFRPIELEKTEVRTWGFKPKHEDPELLAARIRQYEDFFNASGLATPDDLAAYNSVQIGCQARGAKWSDISRGFTHMMQGPDERARQLGVNPLFLGTTNEDEGLFLNLHRRWLELLEEGAERDKQATAREAAE